MRSKKEENSFNYLLFVYEKSISMNQERLENSWEIFKFYITLLTGVGSVAIALISFDVDNDTLMKALASASGLVFFLGLSIFVQLVNNDMFHSITTRRIQLLMSEIYKHTNLTDYDKEYIRIFGKTPEYTYQSFDRFSLKGVIYRAVTAAGVKTKMIVINSVLGSFAVTIMLNDLSFEGGFISILFGMFFGILFIHVSYYLFRGIQLKHMWD